MTLFQARLMNEPIFSKAGLTTLLHSHLIFGATVFVIYLHRASKAGLIFVFHELAILLLTHVKTGLTTLFHNHLKIGPKTLLMNHHSALKIGLMIIHAPLISMRIGQK